MRGIRGHVDLGMSGTSDVSYQERRGTHPRQVALSSEEEWMDRRFRFAQEDQMDEGGQEDECEQDEAQGVEGDFHRVVGQPAL